MFVRRFYDAVMTALSSTLIEECLRSFKNTRGNFVLIRIPLAQMPDVPLND